MSKVYCSECKYWLGKSHISIREHCKAEIEEYDNYYNHVKEWISPEKKNKNNDCKDFEKKKHWWY